MVAHNRQDAGLLTKQAGCGDGSEVDLFELCFPNQREMMKEAHLPIYLLVLSFPSVLIFNLMISREG